MKTLKFDDWYKCLIQDILLYGEEELNKRTGHKTKSIAGITFRTDIEKDGFPLLTLRPLNLKAPIAEQIWFLGGEQKPEIFLNKFTKIWDNFIDNNGKVTAAYGYRWREHFGIDQIETIISKLKEDSSSRHGVVVTWDPKIDLVKELKNVPCPYTFTINIINGRLNMHNIMRSNDVMLGLPFDVFGFALLQSMIAQRLGVKVGVYTHSISNAHIYDDHYETAKIISMRFNPHNKIELLLPLYSYKRATNLDESLVQEIVDNLESQYKPLEKVDKINIIK